MLNETVKQNLKAIVGPARFIDAPEDLLAYSYDAFVEEKVPELDCRWTLSMP